MQVVRLGIVIAGMFALLALSACANVNELPSPPAETTMTDTPTPSPATSTSQPSPTSTPTPTPNDVVVNGFNARQVWDLCRAQGEGSGTSVANFKEQPFDPADVTQAFDGDGVQVRVRWSATYGGDPVSTYWACAFNGDPSTPNLKAFGTPSK